VVERWNGQAWTLVARSRPPPKGGPVSSSSLDLAIEPDGTWVILFGDGFLSVLDSAGQYLAGFDSTTRVPPSAQRLLVLADGKRVSVGGGQGLAVLSPQ
jgi:hypothetical protein